jgi:ssDNA-binding Zn-finger/Zn-ribbon topoisomerase 1
MPIFEKDNCGVFPNRNEMEMTQIQLEIMGCPHCHAKPMIREDKPSEFSDRFECECNEHALVQIDRGVRHCPDCGAPKVVHQIRSFTIRCQQHPAFPVFASDETLETTLFEWNDADDWLKIGADATKLAARPIYAVDFHSLAVNQLEAEVLYSGNKVVYE